MTLAIVGTGLVSPVGFTPQQHVFFSAAGLPAPSPSPFVDAQDKRVDVRYCRHIGAKVPLSERLFLMAKRAVKDALDPLRQLGFLTPREGEKPDVTDLTLSLAVCTRAPSDLFSARSADDLARALASDCGASLASKTHGEAGVFSTLRDAESLAVKSASSILCVVAVDSFVDLNVLAYHLTHPPSPWARDPLPFSEGAAALALMTPPGARRAGSQVIASIVKSAVSKSVSADDNDEPPDGTALGKVFRETAQGEAVGAVFGQSMVDDFRSQEWNFASARNAEMFGPACTFSGAEDYVGRMGAAAGVANVVWGVSTLRHHLPVTPADTKAHFSWAISPDGLRGGAWVRLGAS
ncbi:MAG: hypothetical protein IPK82_21550 [Polyangiaceae bacterium]|nr:hypothetical protein [Polyangiaceae bacterium]